MTDAAAAIEDLWRRDSRRVLATLVRLLRDWDLAEESMQDAFADALSKWPTEGVPSNPRAWIVTAARFRGIDRIRRSARFSPLPEDFEEILASGPPSEEVDAPADDLLRMVFACCHPALAKEARVALTLREVCGLSTEEIAAAFLVPPQTLAQRIVRAKAKIRHARIPFAVPSGGELSERLDGVLQVVYLVFNEGYWASEGASLIRPDLASEAIRLGGLVADLLPDPEAKGLLALMLLQDSRRGARVGPDGDLVLLEEQDRSLWDADQARRGRELVDSVFASGRVGPYAIQAAIAALHSCASKASETDWPQIAGLYAVLARCAPSPVVDLNAAVAEGMAFGPEIGLRRIEAATASGALDAYAPAHAARGAFLERVGRRAAAAAAYAAALPLVPADGPQRRFLSRRAAALASEEEGSTSSGFAPCSTWSSSSCPSDSRPASCPASSESEAEASSSPA